MIYLTPLPYHQLNPVSSEQCKLHRKNLNTQQDSSPIWSSSQENSLGRGSPRCRAAPCIGHNCSFPWLLQWTPRVFHWLSLNMSPTTRSHPWHCFHNPCGCRSLLNLYSNSHSSVFLLDVSHKSLKTQHVGKWHNSSTRSSSLFHFYSWLHCFPRYPFLKLNRTPLCDPLSLARCLLVGFLPIVYFYFLFLPLPHLLPLIWMTAVAPYFPGSVFSSMYLLLSITFYFLEHFSLCLSHRNLHWHISCFWVEHQLHNHCQFCP